MSLENLYSNRPLPPDDILKQANERIFHHEEVMAGRIGVRLIGIYPGLGVEVQDRTVKMYAYVRAIEDKVDNGNSPENASQIVQRELEAIKRYADSLEIEENPDFPQAVLLPLSLEGLETGKKNSILSSMEEIIQGITWDLEAVGIGGPLDDEKLRKRHLYASMSGFQIFSKLFFDRELGGKGNDHVEELFRTWVRYDALVDLEEDLRSGLVLFYQSELDDSGITLEKGKPVPPEFEKLFSRLKPAIIVELLKRAKFISETSLPEPFTSALKLYFITRVLKLMRTRYPKKPIIFSENTYGQVNAEYASRSGAERGGYAY